MIVAVCTFSKWVEARSVRVLDSYHAALFLHEEIICRFGYPTAVRVDRGSEYAGEFARYCR